MLGQKLSHPPPASRHPSPVTRYPSPATRYPSPATRHPPPATRHPRKSPAGLGRVFEPPPAPERDPVDESVSGVSSERGRYFIYDYYYVPKHSYYILLYIIIAVAKHNRQQTKWRIDGGQMFSFVCGPFLDL